MFTDEESNIFEILCQTESSGRQHSARREIKKGIGIYLSNNVHDCLTNLKFIDDVLQFASPKEQSQKMISEFKKSIEKVGLRIHPEKTKILSNQSSDTRKEIEVDDIKSQNTDKRRKREILGSDDHVTATRDDRN